MQNLATRSSSVFLVGIITACHSVTGLASGPGSEGSDGTSEIAALAAAMQQVVDEYGKEYTYLWNRTSADGVSPQGTYSVHLSPTQSIQQATDARRNLSFAQIRDAASVAFPHDVAVFGESAVIVGDSSSTERVNCYIDVLESSVVFTVIFIYVDWSFSIHDTWILVFNAAGDVPQILGQSVF